MKFCKIKKTCNYLDSNFVGQKVDRIKYMADLFRQLLRLDLKSRHNGVMIDLGLNPIGVHLIDNELENKF
jgi:hypothetical protein